MTTNPSNQPSAPLSISILIIGGTGIIAAAGQLQSVLAIVIAGLSVWLGLQFFVPSRPIPQNPRHLIHGLLLLMGWGLWVTNNGKSFIEEERWAGLITNVVDKYRLEESPGLFPRVLHEGIPQTFYVQSDQGQSSTLSIGSQSIPGIPIGNGLFRHTLKKPSLSLEPGPFLTVTLIIDGTTHDRKLKRISPLAHPRWFCSAPSLEIAATISEETDEGILLNAAGTYQNFSTGESPSDCLILPHSNQLLISHRYEESIWVFDLKTLELLKRINVGWGQHRLALSPDESHIAILQNHSSSALLLSAASFIETDRISLPHPGDWISFGSSPEVVLVSSRTHQSLHRYEKKSGAWKHQSIALGRPVTVMTRDDRGDRVYLAITGYSSDGPLLQENHFIQDQILAFNTHTLSLEKRFITHREQSKSNETKEEIPWIAGGSPLGIALSIDHLLIAFAGTNEIWRISKDLEGPITRETFSQDELRHPVGIAWLGNDAWVASSPSMGAVEIRNPKGSTLIHLAKPNRELPQNQLAVRLGENVFYESTRTGRSCQSCHLHGDSDYCQHNIGDTEIHPSTLSIRGISGTSPYLRQGSYNQIAHLMELLDFTLGGFVSENTNRGEHLEAFVESQPLSINPKHLETINDSTLATIQSGYETFNTAKCDDCHVPPAFTHLGKIPATNLFPTFPNPTYSLDTPSLLGVWQSAPYLYDGRAATLKSVLSEHNEANRHGDTQNLSPKEKDDLRVFLEHL